MAKLFTLPTVLALVYKDLQSKESAQCSSSTQNASVESVATEQAMCTIGGL